MTGFFSTSVVQQGRPVGLVPRCGACGLYKGCRTPKMGVQGQGRRGVLLVMDGPEEEDAETGLWFQGKHGRAVRGMLERIGVDPDEDTWMTGALICHTDKQPDPKQVLHCQPSLLSTLERLRPRTVVLLGRAALSSLVPTYWKGSLDSLERWTGWTIPGPDYWICPTYHPSQLSWAKNATLVEKELRSHLKAAFALEERPAVAPSTPRLLYEAADVARFLPYFCEQEWVAVDYETNCLKPEYPEARIASCALSDGKRTISFPWNKDVREVMGSFFFNADVRKIAANLKFEERWTRHTYGRGVRNWGWDTMLATHCMDNRPGICSLKFQSFVRMGVPTYNEHVEPYLQSGKDLYNRVFDCPLFDLLHYGGLDAALEYKLAMMQMEDMGL